MQSIKNLEAREDKFNREAIENKKCSVLYSIESGKRKGTLRQLDSGLNEVLAALARKNNVLIGINFKEIKSLEKKEKAERLSRIIQNLKICGKEKTALAVRGNKDSFFALISLGASTGQAKQASSQYF